MRLQLLGTLRVRFRVSVPMLVLFPSFSFLPFGASSVAEQGLPGPISNRFLRLSVLQVQKEIMEYTTMWADWRANCRYCLVLPD